MFKELKTKTKIPTYKYLVEGEWQESRSRKLISIFSSIDRSLVGRIQSVKKNEANLVVTGASIAQAQWAKILIAKKMQILKRAAISLSKNKSLLAKLLIQEVGKIKKDAESEVEHSVEIINKVIKNAQCLDYVIKKENETCNITCQPAGVVLCISPFNYPIYTAISQIIPAIIAGNSVILKPSIYGSISTLHLAQILNKAGLPAGVINVITGRGNDIGRYLATHELINMTYFTGSTKVGKEIAKKTNMAQVVLEMGGKDAAIVLKDADLEHAAREIVDGAFLYSGQRCMAIKRVIVDTKIKDKLISKMGDYIKRDFAEIGDPRDAKTQLGPVISDIQADYIEKLIKDARKKGAKVICGGVRFNVAKRKMKLSRRLLELPRRVIRLRRGQGRYFCPTILDKVKPNMRIAWEEQFGPVLPVISVRKEAEMINITNASEYGLDAAIFTKDINKARKMAEDLNVGQVFVNMKPHRAPDEFPFTGAKNSGMGTQGIPYTQKEMIKIKSLRISS